MKATPTTTVTTEELVNRFIDEARHPGGTDVATETKERLAMRLREEGVHDERMIEHLILSLQPGGEKRILPDETREQAVTRLIRHFGYDEQTAQFTISLSEGWSDLVPVDDDGNDLPYFRYPDPDEVS